MGMFDTVVVLDSLSLLRCSEGHVLGSFKTKGLARPSFNAYLVHGGRLYLAASGEHELDDESQQSWRIEGQIAVRERRYRLLEVEPPSRPMTAWTFWPFSNVAGTNLGIL